MCNGIQALGLMIHTVNLMVTKLNSGSVVSHPRFFNTAVSHRPCLLFAYLSSCLSVRLSCLHVHVNLSYKYHL